MDTAIAANETPDMTAIRTPEHKLRMKIGRTIGRGVWQASFNAEFPDATKEERKAAWEESRKDFAKIGLKALKTLRKNGFEVIETADDLA